MQMNETQTVPVTPSTGFAVRRVCGRRSARYDAREIDARRKTNQHMTGINYSTALARGLALRCPRCGQGALFRNFFAMHHRCSACEFVYERAPGFFLGSAYINYGFTVVSLTALYMGLHFGAGLSNQAVTPWLVIYFLTVPLLLFRYARSLWLAMDCYYDAEGADVNDPYERPMPPDEVTP